MNDSLGQRVRAAAAAGWWTVLIAVAWLTASWLAWMAILHSRPKWILTLWGGGDLGWPAVQNLTLWFFGVFKLILFVMLLATIWLTLWSRRLRRLRRTGP